MSHDESSHTAASSEENLTRIGRCMEKVEEYKRGELSKPDAIHLIHGYLADYWQTASHPAATNSTISFGSYIEMLDNIDDANQAAVDVGRRESHRESSPHHSEAPESSSQRGVSHSAPGRRRKERHGGDHDGTPDDSEEEEDRPRKARRGVVDEALFPWERAGAAVYPRLGNSELEVDQTLLLLDNWSSDPSFVVHKIMQKRGCPDFPKDQWLNLVKGQPVELEKVLGMHYSSSLETKQSRDLGDLFQISVKVPKTFRPIQNLGDWVIAFGKLLEAIEFILPHLCTEYRYWYRYISRLFAMVQPSYYYKLIEFDKAVRLRISNQKFIRLTDYPEFDDLRTLYLASIGMGANSNDRGNEGRSKRGDKKGNTSGRRDACNKWNRGTCEKSASECFYEHCCNIRNCRGTHRRSDHPGSTVPPSK